VDQSVPAFLQNIQFIAREIDSKRPGAQLVLTRMADVILIQAIRAYIEGLPEGTDERYATASRTNLVPRICAWTDVVDGGLDGHREDSPSKQPGQLT
jgi:hypothetical protein